MLAIWPTGFVWSKAVAKTAQVVVVPEHSLVVRFGSGAAGRDSLRVCQLGNLLCWLDRLQPARSGRSIKEIDKS
jgi:hypothetical protein